MAGGDIFSIEYLQKSLAQPEVENLLPRRSSIDQSLDKVLSNVLAKLRIPLSISYLNSFLSQMKFKLIGESFLKCRENQNKYSFFIIGSDLKIQLQKSSENNDDMKLSSDECRLIEIIDKDMRNLKYLETMLKKDNTCEVTFERFLEKYSSNKYKMNLHFIVRNSHALRIYKKEETYVSLLNELEKEKVRKERIVESVCRNGLEYVVVECIKRLLSKFTKPLENLSYCFKFENLVIDKRFLSKYHDIFAGTVIEGVILKELGRSNNTISPVQAEMKDEKEEILPNIQVAIEEKRSVVIVGSSEMTPCIIFNCETSNSGKLDALQKLHACITSEIEKIK